MKRSHPLAALLLATPLAAAGFPHAPADLVFEERNGIVAFEAEHAFEQKLTEQRAWHLTTAEQTPSIKPDGDPSNIAGASGGAYLEILPDTRRSHGDKLINGQNFSNEPGKIGILSYKVHFNTPGTYWIWARALSTTSEDNGLHFGIDGSWPETARRWQTVVKNRWHWESRQRTTKVHTGVKGILTLEVDKPGLHTIHVSMREDGIEIDKFLLANRKDYKPDGLGPAPVVKSGKLPAAHKSVPSGEAAAPSPAKPVPAQVAATPTLAAPAFDAGPGYYVDRGKWLAINPDKDKKAEARTVFPFPSGRYNVTLRAVGENDGSSTYQIKVGESKAGDFTCPLADKTYDEGPKYWKTWQNLELGEGDIITVASAIASKDGEEFSRARWSHVVFEPADPVTRKAAAEYMAKAAPVKPVAVAQDPAIPTAPLVQPRQPDGKGGVEITGDLKQWHKLTLTLDGPFAHEQDNQPNPFTDCRMSVKFTHQSGSPSHLVPGYFAADGNAANSSAQSGTKWKAHLSPDKPGNWNYAVSFRRGARAALSPDPAGASLEPFDGATGSFTVAATDKTAPDFRARGRLGYVGKHHLQFAGDKSFFVKAGADAPETLLGYADFDGTRANNPKKVPLKTYQAHVRDWQPGDPSWKDGKGKGLVGALNYLSSKGMNAFSFLPYNAGGDGDNVWPFISRDDKFHYDCSKLDQWGMVFDHGTNKGLYLHFKMQETEMDDNRGHKGQNRVPTSLDGGELGPERMLYCRELVARFGHNLALNWNLGEENTQTTSQQMAMAGYIRTVDPYDHHIVVHTFPDQQEKVYRPLLGRDSPFTGASLQNSNVTKCHHEVVGWIRASAKAGKPWAVAFDEPGDATYGMPPDEDYPGMAKLRAGKDGNKIPTVDQVRKYTLWGTLMAGGTGVEYYFGYKLPQNDLLCEDWRSRDQSWDYARIALDFFQHNRIPFQDMAPADELVGNTKLDNSAYCFAKEGEVYLVYLPDGGQCELKLPGKSVFNIAWFNPRTGELGTPAPLKSPTIRAADNNDWLAIVR